MPQPKISKDSSQHTALIWFNMHIQYCCISYIVVYYCNCTISTPLAEPLLYLCGWSYSLDIIHVLEKNPVVSVSSGVNIGLSFIPLTYLWWFRLETCQFLFSGLPPRFPP